MYMYISIHLYGSSRGVSHASQPVCVVHHVEQVARLRPEGAHLAVRPAGEDGGARAGESNAVHCKIGNLHKKTKKLALLF